MSTVEVQTFWSLLRLIIVSQYHFMEKKTKPPIVIIGAGVAGLIAAYHLEEAGYRPLILEATDRPGGRIKTESSQGYLLDHGFQVLLTAYQEANRYLDFEALQLRYFEQGAVIFSNGQRLNLYDPIHDWSKAIPMALSPVGTLKDKWLVWQLRQKLKRKENGSLFEDNDESTLVYLEKSGFSKKMIDQFFRPFFGGIFLENELKTPASMFRFVFKMFSEGQAAIPMEGMEAIPRQLAGKLKQSELKFNTKVKRVEGQEIHLEDGKSISYERLIIAADPHEMLPGLADQNLNYNSTVNIYFKVDRSLLSRPCIALVADKDKLVNNFCVLTDVATGYGGPQSLLSVSLKSGMEFSEDLPEKISGEIRQLTGLPELRSSYLSHFEISEALPKLPNLAYDLPATQFKIMETVFLAGDYLLNASLDAAMRSGRKAAEAVLQSR